MFAGLRFAGVFAVSMGIFCATLLPSAAGEYRGAGSNFMPHDMHGQHFSNHREGFGQVFVGRRMPQGSPYDRPSRGLNIRNDHPGFGRDHRFWQAANSDRFHANHPHYLQRLASGDFSTERGSGITIQRTKSPDYNFISNDAGASDSYATAAGTYSIGYGDYREENRSVKTLMPRAKIIDIATMHDACAYESDVCVIRP